MHSLKHLLLLAIAGQLTFLSAQAQNSRGLQVTLKGSQTPTQLYSGSHALLIGNAEYEDAGWSDLDRIPGELEEVRTALSRQGFQIYKKQVHLNLKDRELQNLVEDFIDDYGVGAENRENRLVVFYSGHGDSDEDRGFLVPVDAPSPRTDPSGFRKKAIEMSRVANWATRIDAKHVLFCFDSCFSGTVFTGRARTEVPLHIDFKTTKPVRQFLTSGAKDETVPAKSSFAPYFVRGIQGEADMGEKDGYVTVSELEQYLTPKVARATKNHVQFGDLPHPYDEGDVVFEVPVMMPQEATREKPFVNSLGMKFVPVPGTKVLFCIWETRFQDFEVFAAEYRVSSESWKVVSANVFNFVQEPDFPVGNVAYEDAKKFCEWLAKREGRKYRLPTDHEWSIAVGIGDLENESESPSAKDGKIAGVYPWGTSWPPPENQVNLGGRELPSAYSEERLEQLGKVINLKGMSFYEDSFPNAAPVGSFSPNQFGLFDLGGNVSEVCEYDDPSGERKVGILRGGCFLTQEKQSALSSRRSIPLKDKVSSQVGEGEGGNFALNFAIGLARAGVLIGSSHGQEGFRVVLELE